MDVNVPTREHNSQRGHTSRATVGVRPRQMPAEHTLLVITRIVDNLVRDRSADSGGLGGIFPRGLIYLIVATYYNITPPMIACNWNMMAIIRDRELRMGHPQFPHDHMLVAKLDRSPVALTCGANFMIATCERGFYSWGVANDGCLATTIVGSQVPSKDGPAYIPIGAPVIMIACGRHHVMMIIEIGIANAGHIEAVERGEIADTSTILDTSGCGARKEHRLYGWGHIEGLGLKYQYPRVSFEPTYYDLPQQIMIDDPDSVSCGDDYSLILARGVVYLCQDTELRSEGGGRYNGQGPRKLGFSEVTKMFACCGSYVIWTMWSCTHRANSEYDQGITLLEDSDGRATYFVDVEDAGYADCYEDIYRFISTHSRSERSWPPSACLVEDMLCALPNVNRQISAAGNRGAVLLLTTEEIYLVREDGHMRLCAW